MSVTEIIGDLFEVDLPAIGHGCNTKGSMGAGIAVEFRRRYPEMYEEYKRRCATDRFRLGDVFTWEANDRVIYNMATQPRPGPSATLEAIHQSVSLALDDADRRGLTKLGLPRLGAGLGGLDWQHVLGTLEDASRSHPTKLIVVSLPSATG